MSIQPTNDSLREATVVQTRLPIRHLRREPVQVARRTGQPAPEVAISPLFILRVFTNWWKWVIALSLLSAAISSGLILYFHVPHYRASAMIKIEPESPYIAFEERNSASNAERYVQTQIELLKSPVVLTEVLANEAVGQSRELKGKQDPLESMLERLTVRQQGKSELFNISYETSDPNEAAMVANLVVAEYFKLQTKEESERARVVIDVLDNESNSRSVRVEQLRKQVVDISKQLTGRDPFDPNVVTDTRALAPASSVYQALTEVEVAIEVYQAELQALQNTPMNRGTEREISKGVLELEVASRPEMQKFEQSLMTVANALADIKGKSRLKIGDTWEKDPDYQSLVAEERRLQEEMAKTKDLLIEKMVREKEEENLVQRERDLEAKKQEIVRATKKKEMLEAKLTEQMTQLTAGSAKSAELEFARAELEREEKVFELIASRKLALQTEQRAPAQVSLIRKAPVPLLPIEPIPYKFLVLAGLASLAVPLVPFVVYESTVQRIAGTEQLLAESQLPILGEVAELPRARVAARAMSLQQQRAALVFAESIDGLRTQLALTENLGVGANRKVVAICSAASGEGKTSVASALAMSIAEATKQPTLIIDADLRAPDVARALEVPAQPGLAEVMLGEISLQKAIHRVAETQAFVLPAGKLRGNPHHVFQGSRIDTLLQQLRKSFGTIIIDTPPVLAASEALVYAKAADLVVFCSLADVSRAKRVRLAVERLQATGANVAGAVLSGVSASQYIYDYGTYGKTE